RWRRPLPTPAPLTPPGPGRLDGATPYRARRRARGAPWDTAPGRVATSNRPPHRPHTAGPALVASPPPLCPAGGPHPGVPRLVPGASAGDGRGARHRAEKTERPW